jgi:hypothetical protein
MTTPAATPATPSTLSVAVLTGQGQQTLNKLGEIKAALESHIKNGGTELQGIISNLLSTHLSGLSTLSGDIKALHGKVDSILAGQSSHLHDTTFIEDANLPVTLGSTAATETASSQIGTLPAGSPDIATLISMLQQEVASLRTTVNTQALQIQQLTTLTQNHAAQIQAHTNANTDLTKSVGTVQARLKRLTQGITDSLNTTISTPPLGSTPTSPSTVPVVTNPATPTVPSTTNSAATTSTTTAPSTTSTTVPATSS